MTVSTTKPSTTRTLSGFKGNKNLSRSSKCKRINRINRISPILPSLLKSYIFILSKNKFNKTKVIENGASLYQAKGVEDFLNRQKKVKKIQDFI